MSVRVAILGNSFARLVQLPALAWARENGAPHRVVALAGQDIAKARATAEEWDVPVATGDWTELFGPGAEPLDLVIVSTPVDLHGPMVRAALAAGAAILCEKPFSLDGDEARELAALARGRLALIDHQTRWSPWRRAFARAVADGVVGRPWAARVHMKLAATRRLDAPFSWWYDAARGGGTLGAIGSHAIDGIVHQYGRRFVDVMARLDTFLPERPGPDGATVAVTADEEATLLCTLDGGLPLTLEVSIAAFGCERDGGEGILMELRGDRATLRLENETELVLVPHGGAPRTLPVDPLPTNADYGFQVDGMFPRCLPTYLRDVLQAVAAGRSELPGAATFQDAVHVMDVMDAARASHREGRRVAVRRD